MSPFTLTHTSGSARAGLLKTAHGTIETPFFMPAATRASGKYLTTDDYHRIGIPNIICNSLILSLRPGTEVIQKAGGLHTFMNFPGIIFTDCGGFQMSRSMFEKKSEQGLHFRSPYDNRKIVLTPQKIMEIQVQLGSDVAMMLDDMSPYGATYEEAQTAMHNTHRWAKESLEAHTIFKKRYSSSQLLFGIVQGNVYPDLRKESAQFISSLPFDGIAIGGVAIGEPLEQMYQAIDVVLPFIPKNQPRYVMGVGSPLEILDLIERGIDCFDSVYPAKMSRHSHLFTKNGPLIVDRPKYAQDFTPLEADCECLTCKNFTRAYLYHLTKIDEPAVKRLKTIHNLFFLTTLLKKSQKAIQEGIFSRFKKKVREEYQSPTS